jgi:protein-S-isoprenylcysteine O-methyltransferase Ste14
MPRTDPDRINPWVPVAIAAGLIGAFFFYTGHPMRDSNLYSPHAQGWIAVVIFVVIGALASIVRLRDRARDAKKGKSYASRKT